LTILLYDWFLTGDRQLQKSAILHAKKGFETVYVENKAKISM
jgi:hypothetical protein